MHIVHLVPLYNVCYVAVHAHHSITDHCVCIIMQDPRVPGQVDFGNCKASEAGCFPVEGARPVSTIMTRYVTRALKQWRIRQEQERVLLKQQHKAAHPGLGGSLQRRKKALADKFSSSVQQVRLHVEDDNYKHGLVIV